MDILVIGSNGFIGSNAVNYFVNSGHYVIGCDIATGIKENYYTIHNPAADFDNIFSKHNFEVCINASGLANVQLSFEQPLLDFELNVQNVYTILTCIKNHNPGCKFINFSSAAVYGNPRRLPIAETDTLQSLSPYGRHKYYSELICKEFHDFFNIPTCNLRVFSAYGNELTKQLFWDLYQKQKLNNKVKLFGTGLETRDFIHIDDLLQATECIIHKGSFIGDSVNIANGEEETIRKVAYHFLKIFNEEIELEFTGEIKKGDPGNWRADITKLKRLGYKKQINIEEGLSKYAQWLKEKK